MSSQLEIGGHRLRVVVEGEGFPVWLCLHGLVDRIEIWDHVAPALALRGRVIRFDQRGHGESEAPPGPYSREELARDVVGVLDALGVEKAVLLGHSMGGVVAMAAALAFPERVDSLVLIGTASQSSEKVALWYERIAKAGEANGTTGIAKAIYGKDTAKTIDGDAKGIASVTRVLKSLYEDPLSPKLSAISCPVLLVVGEKDPMGPRASAILAEGLAQARLVEIPDCGHWVHVEKPEAVIGAIESWRFATSNSEPAEIPA